jgi:hypothetical protein
VRKQAPAGLLAGALMMTMAAGVAAAQDDPGDACMKGGWEDLQGIDGGFTSKRDCLDYVESGGTLLPTCTPGWADLVGPQPGLPGFGDTVPAGMVACASTGYANVYAVEGVFIGDDGRNEVHQGGGTFYGMGGCDFVLELDGVFYGGDGNDFVHALDGGTFYGGVDNDGVNEMRGGSTFDGGPGVDSVAGYVEGKLFEMENCVGLDDPRDATCPS